MASASLESITSSNITRTGNDSVSERWIVQYDAIPTQVDTALTIAEQAGLPNRFAQYNSTSLFVDTRSHSVSKENRSVWFWDVTYATLEPNEDQSQLIANPLDRPIVWDLDTTETDERITTAKNVEVLARAAGGSQRDAGTEGPITNAAGEQPDEALTRPVQNAVYVGTINKPSLASIASLVNTYKNTANSSAIAGFDARTLQFYGARSLGRQEENGFEYFPCEIRIEVVKTTDLVIDNVGWHYWKSVTVDGVTEEKLTRAQVNVTYEDSSGETKSKKADSAAPVNLTLSGVEGLEDFPTSITYRHRTDTDYTNLINYGT